MLPEVDQLVLAVVGVVVLIVLVVHQVKVVHDPGMAKEEDNNTTHQKVQHTNHNNSSRIIVCTTPDYSPLATAPSSNYNNRSGQAYAGAYGGDRNAYEMRHKV